MKKSIEEHAARFDAIAPEYDEDQTEEYRACVSLVIEHAAPSTDDVVLDLGCGTGAIGLALAPDAKQIIGRDISAGMLQEAQDKATSRGLDNVSFDQGRFQDPNYDGPVDIVVSNFAMHHLTDEQKADALTTIAELSPQRIVLGDVMLFEDSDPTAPFFDPEVDDPATVGTLVELMTDVGYVITAVARVHDQAGVIVAEQAEI